DLLGQEAIVRFGCFSIVLLCMATWELCAPRRRLNVHRPVRWASNLGLVLIDAVVARLVLPMGAIGVALAAAEGQWGLFNNVDWPDWLAVALGVVILDLLIYIQHVLFHALPILWRLHLVHHVDLDVDATTGIRFHPLEILLSLGIKLVAIILLG